MIVSHDLPIHYYAFYAIQKVHFVITLISLGCQNECYNEVVVYLLYDCRLHSFIVLYDVNKTKVKIKQVLIPIFY